MLEYSVVIPIYGDAYLARPCVERLYSTLQTIVGDVPLESAAEIILIVDGRQADFDEVAQFPSTWPAVKVLFLSRNFGQHSAISAGYEHAAGAKVIRLNVDCQDPPEAIPSLLEALDTQGADQVIGAYAGNANPLWRRATSRAFYAVFNWLSGYEMPVNTAPLRVMTRRYIDEFNRLPERNRFPQSLDEHLGFKKVYVTIKHEARADGRSAYTVGMRLRLAIDAAVGFSDRLMYRMIKFGVLVFLAGLGYLLYSIYRYLFVAVPISGFTTIIALLTIFAASIYMGIGVLGLYVSDIQREVKGRPYYLIRDRINF